MAERVSRAISSGILVLALASTIRVSAEEANRPLGEDFGVLSKQVAGLAERLNAPPANSGPTIDGHDISAVIGAYRMAEPQFGCPMTVYARFQDGTLQVRTDEDDKTKPSGGRTHWPRYTFMNRGESYVWAEDKDSVNRTRSVETSVHATDEALIISQRSMASQKQKGLFAGKPLEYGGRSIELSLENGRSLALRSAADSQAAGPDSCRFDKVSEDPSPVSPRTLHYSFQTPVLLGGDRAFGIYHGGTPGILRASFDLDEFSRFEGDTKVRNFSWQLVVDGGRRFVAERPLPTDNWRRDSSGWMSAGTAPLRLFLANGGGIGGALESAMNRGVSGAFIIELESSGTTPIGGKDHVLRVFIACAPDLRSCGLIPSVIDHGVPGFYHPPFGERPDLAVIPAGTSTFPLEH